MGHRDLERHAVELGEAATALATAANRAAKDLAWGRGIRVDTAVLAQIIETLKLVGACLHDVMSDDPGRNPYKRRVKHELSRNRQQGDV